MDCALIANECIDASVKGKEDSMICKVDVEKAHDHVNWEFMDDKQAKMGFGRKWWNWIKVCILMAFVYCGEWMLRRIL